MTPEEAATYRAIRKQIEREKPEINARIRAALDAQEGDQTGLGATMRYRLRTLIVMVTIVAGGLGWIAWQKRIVDRRQECARLLNEGGDGIVIAEGAELSKAYEIVSVGDKSQRVSLVRRWLGDVNGEAILFYGPTRIDRSIVEEFPEADVWLAR